MRHDAGNVACELINVKMAGFGRGRKVERARGRGDLDWFNVGEFELSGVRLV